MDTNQALVSFSLYSQCVCVWGGGVVFYDIERVLRDTQVHVHYFIAPQFAAHWGSKFTKLNNLVNWSRKWKRKFDLSNRKALQVSSNDERSRHSIDGEDLKIYDDKNLRVTICNVVEPVNNA